MNSNIPLQPGSLEDCLRDLSTCSHNIHKRLFNLRSSKDVSFTNASSVFHEAYCRIRWDCKDVAGDIRSSITDFQYAILKSLEGGNLQTKEQLVLIDGWASLESDKRSSAAKLPKELEKLADNMLSCYTQMSNNDTCLPIVQRVVTWVRFKLKDLTVSSQRKPAWNIARIIAKLTEKVSHKLSSTSNVNDAAELYAIAQSLRLLAKDVLIFDELYGQILHVVSIVRATLDTGLNDQSIAFQIQYVRDTLDTTATALESFQKTV